MRDLELAFDFPDERTPKPRGVFDHHEPHDPDRAEAERSC